MCVEKHIILTTNDSLSYVHVLSKMAANLRVRYEKTTTWLQWPDVKPKLDAISLHSFAYTLYRGNCFREISLQFPVDINVMATKSSLNGCMIFL